MLHHQHDVCRIDRNSDTAHLILAAELIVWDEAPMMHKHVFEYLERALRDVTRVDALFGGKVVILGGDFRQIPTVIPRGSRAQVCEASLKRAYFWPTMKKLELEINMQVQSLSGDSSRSCCANCSCTSRTKDKADLQMYHVQDRRLRRPDGLLTTC